MNDKVEQEDSKESGVNAQLLELQMLKKRADHMGISYSNNIGTDALKKKIEEKMEDKNKDTISLSSLNENQKKAAIRAAVIKENLKLVRIRISCLDPKKSAIPGEFITVANEYLGTVKKYIPYGEKSDQGYHIPYCIYKLLAKRTYTQITTTKDPMTGSEIVKTREVPEYSIQILPPLSEAEIQKISRKQLAELPE